MNPSLCGCEIKQAPPAGEHTGQACPGGSVFLAGEPALVFPCTPFPGGGPFYFYYPIQAHQAAEAAGHS